ncbi:hypothetical protein Y032_0017g3223 [Ancylostoma ceylanicum]|uniref:Uncharacterized protein n=1 Tax=Ancylostoma ceylanicum TaxID=53326 RepID=A0A016V446_9BILA|nr:hypothetical protein Y032_0017g3223 [Ancylostoma ceylanicum]
MGFGGCGAFVRVRPGSCNVSVRVRNGGPAATTRSIASATVARRLRRVSLFCPVLSVVQTSRYMSSLAKDYGKRQATDPPWPSSEEKTTYWHANRIPHSPQSNR